MGKAKSFKPEVIRNRVEKATLQRAKLLLDVSKLHVRVMKGNHKTGTACWTVSLIPGCDCACSCTAKADENFSIEGNKHNGGCLFKGCYDIQNDWHNKDCVAARAQNSAIHKADPARYWKEIGEAIDLNGIEQLRINVGGDLADTDFAYVAELGKAHPTCDILFFTKNYDGINYFLREGNTFPENVKAMISVWPGIPYENPFNLPKSHIVWEDGTTTLKDYTKAMWCGGNCSVCHAKHEGCWTLNKGDNVLFPEH